MAGKRRIKQNRWGNWYGYEGARRVQAFGNSREWTAEQQAQAWLATGEQLTPGEQLTEGWVVKTAEQLEAEGAPIAKLAAAAQAPAAEGDRWHRYSRYARGLTGDWTKRCTACGRLESLTEDWTLWPWPDAARLCSSCNDERHEVDEYE